MYALLFVAMLVPGTLHVRATWRGDAWVALAWKPVPVFLAMAAVAGGGGPDEAYRSLLLGGLAFSALGDVFLGLPQERFELGLASFLVAHLAYARAFLLAGPPGGTPWLMAGLGLYTALALGVVWPRVGRLKGPVLAYVTALAGMTWLAGERWCGAPSGPTACAFAGACSFLVSDTVLGVHRFVRPLPHRKLVVMVTYYAAQYALACSAL